MGRDASALVTRELHGARPSARGRPWAAQECSPHVPRTRGSQRRRSASPTRVVASGAGVRVGCGAPSHDKAPPESGRLCGMEPPIAAPRTNRQCPIPDSASRRRLEEGDASPSGLAPLHHPAARTPPTLRHIGFTLLELY